MFVAEEQRDRALLFAPEFAEKLLWGDKVVGLRISLAKAKPALVKQLIVRVWEVKAPKSLLAKRLAVTKKKL